jgi:exonuclease III
MGDMRDRVESCWIDKDPRGWERASDHCPILAELTE